MSTFGQYENLAEHLCSIMIDEEEREEFAKMIDKDSLVRVLAEQSDIRFERHVLCNGQPEWEHMNIIVWRRRRERLPKH